MIIDDLMSEIIVIVLDPIVIQYVYLSISTVELSSKILRYMPTYIAVSMFKSFLLTNFNKVLRYTYVWGQYLSIDTNILFICIYIYIYNIYFYMIYVLLGTNIESYSPLRSCGRK